MFVYQQSSALFFLLTAFIVTSVGITMLFRYRTPVAGWGGALMLAIGFDLVSYFMVLTSSDTEAFHFSFLLLVITYLFLVVAWLFFIFAYTGHTHWINWITSVSFGIIPILMGVAALTRPGMNPVWVSQGRETIGSLMVLTREFGWFGDLFITYTFLVGIGSAVLLIRILPTTNSYFRGLSIVLILGSLSVALFGLLEVVGKNPFTPIASLQVGYAFASVLAFLFVFKFRAGGSVPIIRSSIFEHLQDGVLVIDRYDNVIDMNPVAERIIGKSGRNAIGKPLSLVWEQGVVLLGYQLGTDTFEGEFPLSVNGTELTFDVNISSVLDFNQTRLARTIVLHNVTGRERMEKALQDHTRELARTNELITTLSHISSRLGSAPDSESEFDILGIEMRKLGLECGIVVIDPAGMTATIRYLSFNPAIVKKVERMTGISAKGYVIPRQNWPGERILKENVPIWYPDPREYIRRMFPQIPDGIAARALQLLGIKPESQICILPLLFQDKLIGAMPIWGGDLNPIDNPVLGLFAGQVSNVLQSAFTRENESKRIAELARSNAMILALSKIATSMGNSTNSKFVLDTLGTEIRGLGLDCGIVTLDPGGDTARIRYLSFDPAIIKTVEKLAGVSAENYVISKRYWPDDRVNRERVPVWYSDPSDMLRGMFPLIPESAVRKVLQILGFKRETQLCMLPLISRENLVGVLLIWGIDLRQSDSSVLSVFASQVAGIMLTISNYETEVVRADELARSNSLILALSKVAAKLESSSDTAEIFDTVGKELTDLGVNSIIGILEDNKQTMRIHHISVSHDIIRWAEKATGHSLKDLTIPRHLWPTEVVVNEGIPFWDPNRMKGTLNMFPILPENMHKMAMSMAGINIDDPVCYLPLANEKDVIGVLAVWGSGLRPMDMSALSVFASQITTAIRNSNLFETESRRARDLALLLEASEATTSSSHLGDVLLSLASKLVELSGFESCYISEWDRETNMITGLIEHSRVFWRKEKRDSYSLNEYPTSREVLLTGKSIILQGDFQAEEKKWMDELGRTALMLLPLKARENTMGLVEIAITKENGLFDPQALLRCQQILDGASDMLFEPLSVNNPTDLFAVEQALLQASGGEVCSLSEWNPPEDQIFTVAVSADLAWIGQNAERPVEHPAWKLALYEGKTSYLVRSDDNQSISAGKDLSVVLDVESSIIFPLQRGDTSIGLVELYDFNHKRSLSPAQIALLRTVADKASYSIQNARLLQQTQQQLGEKTILLEEKEVLLKEVHHRVKNNLQVISSLLNLQSTKISDPEAQDILRESQNRVRTMALIHEKLYQSTDLARVDFASYLRSLVNFLSQSYRGKSDNVLIQIEAQNVMLDIDTAIPCGLIITELVSNSLKYAFPENRRGLVTVTCRHIADGRYELIITDDGIGLPDGFDISKTPSLGHKLVVSLTRQLEGELEIDCTRGTTFRILFERMSHVKGQHTDR